MSDTHSKAVAVIEHQEVARVSPAVQAILERNMDPQTARELLAVQRDWEQGEARKAFNIAKAALLRDMPSIMRRDKAVSYQSSKGRVHYTHTSLAELISTVTPHLVVHGFSLRWETSSCEKQVRVTGILSHVQGHSESCVLDAPVDTSGSKSPAQGTMSTVTLLQRYTAMALLGLASADMHEPRPDRDTDSVSVTRNQRAVAALKKYNRTLEDAEEHIGRAWKEWTAADIDTLAAWAKGEAEPMSADEAAQIDMYLGDEGVA